MKWKEWIILVLIIGTGLILHFSGEILKKISNNFEINFRIGESYLFEETKRILPPFPSIVKVKNKYGKVKIIGSDSDFIEIHLTKRIYRRNRNDAVKIAKNLNIEIVETEQKLIIGSNREKFKRKNFRTDFEILVPYNISVQVDNAYDNVLVKNINNEITIENKYGEVLAEEIRGKTMIFNSYKNIEVKNIKNNCYLQNRYSSIKVSNIYGLLEIKHKYGEIDLNNINGEVNIYAPHSRISAFQIEKTILIENSYKKIILEEVKKVNIKSRHSSIEIKKAKEIIIKNDYGRIYLSNINGNVKIQGKYLLIKGNNIFSEEIEILSSYRNVELIDFSGKLNISLSNGDLILKPIKLIFPIKVKANYSDIEFFWPKGEERPFKGEITFGKVQSSIPIKYYYVDKKIIIKAFQNIRNKPGIWILLKYGNLRIKSRELY